MSRRPPSDATRTRVLDAALRLHATESGSLSVHAIVAESGVSLGSLYHHFGSMEGVAAALYTHCMIALLDELTAAIAGTRSARRAIGAIVRAYLRFARRRPTHARVLHEGAFARFLPAHATAVAAAKAPRLAVLHDFFHGQVAAGALAPLPDVLIEMILIGPVAELTRRWLAAPETVDLDEAARLLPNRIWHALRRTPDL
jgi:AcrR family transcriptional regulator